MSFVAVAVGVGAVATVASGAMSASAQKSAAKKNAAAQQSAEDRNYQMFRESRGEDGNAVLPLYLNRKGDTFENVMGKDAMDAYDAYHQGAASLTDYQQRLDDFAPAISGARKTTNDIFDGGVTDDLMANFKPVKAARLKFKRGAAIDALGKTMSEISAIQTGKGYSGDSLANNLLRFQGRKAAGDEVAIANVQNAEDERGIRDAGVNLRLSNLNLPYAQAKQSLDLFNLPQDTYIDQVMKEQQPFNFFRIGTGTAPQRQHDATPSTGQLALQGVGAGAGTALQYMLQQKQQQAYADALQQQQMMRVGANSPVYNPGQMPWTSGVPATTAAPSYTPGFDYEAAPMSAGGFI